MSEEQIVFVLEEFGVYQELSLRGIFSSEETLLAWVRENVRAPLSNFRVRPETLNFPGQLARCRGLKNVDGQIHLD